MNLRQLEYFIMVAKTKNFTKAAKELYISQTAITKQIQLLENELNAPLFNRQNKQIELNKFGQFFLIEAKRIINQVDLTKNNLTAYHQGSAGTLKLGFLKNLDPTLLVNLVTSFKKHYPLVNLELYSYSNLELYQQLTNSNLDVILGIDNHQNNYQKLLIKKYPLVVLLSKDNPLSSKKTIKLEELNNILFDVRKLDNQNKFPEFEGNLLKIACNQGCAILHSFVKDNCYNEYLKTILLEPIIEEEIKLIYDQNNQNPIISNLITIIKNVSKDQLDTY
ncbi:LysR family transcriptional regulator [uncultured Thomasclavelia sp.]|uniref:LysR family transcriptional regulator n=1 Tax=uncultured Thomasclavelia sp. TaxID=3025759 RepID=UPI0025D41237|nr:LysR family transcriptional regulator [uncultured Thomasclavelia sp.]